MTNWYEILRTHNLIEDGMREDNSVRAKALQSMDIPSVFDHFDAVANVTHNYDADAYEFDKFQDAYDNLPISVRTMLHRTGATHFLTDGEPGSVVDLPDFKDKMIGHYYSPYNAAVTETGSRSIEATARHEAGHALSYVLGNAYRLASALERDLKALSPEDWRKLEAMDVGYLDTRKNRASSRGLTS